MPIKKSAEDRKNENEVAVLLSREWDCSFNRYPQMNYIDWWLGKHTSQQNGEVTALVEIKCVDNEYEKHENVLLSFAKWYHLVNSSLMSGCKPLVIYRFSDGLWFIDCRKIDPRNIDVNNGSSTADIEPMIYIPVEKLKHVKIRKTAQLTTEQWWAGYDREKNSGKSKKDS